MVTAENVVDSRSIEGTDSDIHHGLSSPTAPVNSPSPPSVRTVPVRVAETVPSGAWQISSTPSSIESSASVTSTGSVDVRHHSIGELGLVFLTFPSTFTSSNGPTFTVPEAGASKPPGGVSSRMSPSKSRSPNISFSDHIITTGLLSTGGPCRTSSFARARQTTRAPAPVGTAPGPTSVSAGTSVVAVAVFSCPSTSQVTSRVTASPSGSSPPVTLQVSGVHASAFEGVMVT